MTKLSYVKFLTFCTLFLRLVFSWVFYFCGDLGNVKETPTKKMFLQWNEAPVSTHLPCKIFLGDISLMPNEFQL